MLSVKNSEATPLFVAFLTAEKGKVHTLSRKLVNILMAYNI